MDEHQEPQVLAIEKGRVSEDYNEDRKKGLQCMGMVQARAWSFPSFLGKHRMKVVISHLNNQIDIIKEELEELETVGESSIACKNVISSIESIPDPLLPLTKGPVNGGWDQWFGGCNPNSTAHKRWI